METTFVIEKSGKDFLINIDYFKKNMIINVEEQEEILELSEIDLSKIEELESKTMIKNTKKSWLDLEKYLKGFV